nr:hypothetical protein [Acetobacter persici]
MSAPAIVFVSFWDFMLLLPSLNKFSFKLAFPSATAVKCLAIPSGTGHAGAADVWAVIWIGHHVFADNVHTFSPARVFHAVMASDVDFLSGPNAKHSMHPTRWMLDRFAVVADVT